MFRPAPESTFFGKIPFRLIASVLVILAVVVSVLLLFSLEHETFVIHGLTEGKTVPTELFLGLWQSRRDLIAITVLLFLVSAMGIAAVITFLHYGSTRRTLEEVKGLARNILQSIPTGVVTVNRNGLITAVNPAAASILKRPADQLLGYAYEAVFAEGETMRAVLDSALLRHEHVDHKDLAYGREGDEARTIRVTTADLTGDEGHSAGALLLVKDVTEVLALEQRVRVAEKLAGLHTLSAGVAHELRNPLSAVDLNLHLLEEELKETGASSPKTSQYLRVLNAECRRLTGILDNFMKFARPGSVCLHEVNMRDLIGHIATLLGYDAQERRIRLETSIAEGLPAVLGDETQISQVLVNLVVNAFQAMPDGGTCRIGAAEQRAEGQQWVEITVQDNGVGINRDGLGRLFEPFYTTKAGGSGLGLAVAYRIVEDHGGRIHVSSAPGSGTTVVIRFPLASVGSQRMVGAQ
jgi:PAS domain S-box-containing protein